MGCKTKKSDFSVAMVFMSPFIIGFFVFILYPMLMSFYYSFTDFTALKPPVFTGFKNIASLSKDRVFFIAILNTSYMVILGTPLVCITGLLTAILLNRKVPILSLFRTVIYIPAIVPSVAAALIWTWILNPEYGPINALLRTLGVSAPPGWFADPRFSKPALLFISIWAMGNVMVIFLAALQDVPKELYESASIDGAGSIMQFRKITIPMLKPEIFYNIFVTIIVFTQYFSQGYVSNISSNPVGNFNLGSPLNSTMFYVSHIYQTSFRFFKFGYASLLAWILLIITLLATLLLYKTSNMLNMEDK